ncbi:IMP cyclohydrolase-like protein, partial [human gut metagenome]
MKNKSKTGGKNLNRGRRKWFHKGEFIGLDIQSVLRSRTFEPDGPNYTPRISGIMHIENGTYNYAMSILKSNNGNPESSHRYTFAYENPAAGE